MDKQDFPKTVSVPEAGKLLGLGRDLAYSEARLGNIPTIRFGRLLRVPIVALERMLDQAGTKSAA